MMLERPRRNRKSAAIRGLIRETKVTVDDLVYPLFVQEGKGVKDEIPSLPGNFRWSLDTLIKEIGACVDLGLKSFMVFPKVDDALKDGLGSYGTNRDNYYLKVAREIKKAHPHITLISDVALDPYSSDGHDGIVVDGRVDNDASVALLQQMSVLQAEAGFDILGPSDMMDGRIGAIREALDEEGFADTGIMSYTAKYASALYGPFRDALDSAPVDRSDVPKDKKTYQMDPANKTEALREAELDMVEGADFLMVKPALHYLDIIHLLKDNYNLPIAAYHVSGECAMVLAASQKGWLDYNQIMPETLLSIKRAGADVLISYFAKDYAQLLRKS